MSRETGTNLALAFSRPFPSLSYGVHRDRRPQQSRRRRR